jgi:hypothetical protein
MEHDEKPFERIFHHSVESLFQYYKEHEPAGTKEDFTTRFIAPAVDSDGRIAQIVREVLQQIQETGQPADIRFGTLMIAMGNLAQAMNAYTTGQHETAYILLSEGRYWVGATWAARGLERAREQTIKATDSNRARKAARSKNKGLRERALELARSRKVGLWPSRNYAAGVIASQLRTYADETGVSRLRETEERKTVDRWLAEMEDRSQLFPERKRRS